MACRRAVRLLLLALGMLTGAAEGAAASHHPVVLPGGYAMTGPGSPERAPIHHDIGCVFCQAGLAQPYAPPIGFTPLPGAGSERALPVPDRRRRHSITPGLLPSTRAPPSLRFA